MKIESTKGTAEVETIEQAARWLEEMQPSHASIDGHGIESPEGDWTEDASEAIRAAMAEGDWYWLDGFAYCSACVECDSPAIDSAEATRGPCESGRCACCGAVKENDDDTIFCEATPAQLDRVRAAAIAAGHPGLEAAVNGDGGSTGMWGWTVARALQHFAPEREYSIAFVLEGTGGFEVLETFSAAGNDAANDYAEQNYPGRPWYVLNASGENING